MAYGGVRVSGLTQLTRHLLDLGLEVEDLKGAFSEIAAMGARQAARYAPKRTGTLAGSIRGNRARSKAVVYAGRSSVPYAAPINYGWSRRNIHGSLFMQRADKAVRPFALRRLQADINTQIRKRGLG